MINLSNKENCCGCGACVQICPKKCLSMSADNEGFLYPLINKEACIQCGKCEDICPVINLKILDGYTDVKGYVAYNMDEKIRNASSSGGIFTILSDIILKDNGVVFGAAFNDKFKVNHIAIHNTSDLYLLRGSKYVQSNINNTYIEAKKYLKSGKKVLFSGTSCQIAGLKSYLGLEYKELYTVDVLCHGVPSPYLLEKYIEYKEKAYGAGIKKVFFRNKKYGWKKYSVLLEFSNNKTYEKVFFKDDFMQMFLQDIALRPACYSCKFNKLERCSDITIGDCWGIENKMPDMDDDKGTSVVLIRSQKGYELFKAAVKFMKYKTADIDYILPPDSGGRKACQPHLNRSKFFNKLYNGAEFEELAGLLKLSFTSRIIKKVKDKL